MINILVTLLILVAIFAVLFWAVDRIPIAEPLRTVLICIIAIICILILASLLPVGWHWPGARLP